MPIIVERRLLRQRCSPGFKRVYSGKRKLGICRKGSGKNSRSNDALQKRDRVKENLVKRRLQNDALQKRDLAKRNLQNDALQKRDPVKRNLQNDDNLPREDLVVHDL
jgi:hypothetical protein